MYDENGMLFGTHDGQFRNGIPWLGNRNYIFGGRNYMVLTWDIGKMEIMMDGEYLFGEMAQ